MSHGQQLARGMFWLGSATLVARILDAVSGLVVLGALDGTALGLATIALTVTAFLEGFNALGVNNALIQRAKVSDEEVSSIWWYVLGVAILMSGGVMLSAPLVSRLYGTPELAPLLQFGSLKLVFVGLAAVPLALLNRSLAFKQVGAIMAVSTLLSAILSVTLALLGAGAWAPLVGNTSHGLFQLLGTCVVRFYRPRAGFSWPHVAPLARDGLKLAGAVSVGQLTRNVDYLLLGRMVSLSLLGTYRVAFDIATLPSFVVLQVINRTSFPLYSRIAGEGGDLAGAFVRTLKTVALLLVPALLLAAIDGEALVELFKKPRVDDIGLVIVCLTVAGWLRALSQCTPILMTASGRPASTLFQALSSVALLAGAIVVGLHVWPEHNPLLITAYAWIVGTALQLLVDVWLVRTAVALSGSELRRATLKPLAAALATGAGTLLVRSLVGAHGAALSVTIDTLTIVALFALFLRYGLKVRGLAELRSAPPAA